MAETDNQAVMSKRDMMMERMRNKYPDKQFDDDEALYGQISDDYDALDDELNGYKEREGKFSEMFTSDPRSAYFFTQWRDGGDPVVALVRQFGTDIKDAMDDPERMDAIAEANKEFVERVAKEKELEETYQTNLQESLSALEQWQADNGLSDEQVDEVMQHLIGIVSDGIMGKFTAESMDMALKAINHDTDVIDAEQTGEVRGRNARIDERLRGRAKGDGTASLDGKNSTGAGQSASPRNIFELAGTAR